METYQKLLLENKAWAGEKIQDDPNFFKRLEQIQTPDFLWIGCSDSRVSTSRVTGTQPGEIFVHRNIANMVVHTDLNLLSVLEYAVVHLKVKHIIVCGHYNCGGVKAALEPKDLGILNPWLRGIRDVYRLHKTELNAIKDDHKRYDLLVELNVQEQCINLIKTRAVQLGYVEEGYPIVHGWVFDIKTGRIIDLNIDFPKVMKDLKNIYDLIDD